MKNRKSFFAIIQINNKKRKPKATARVYRIKQNQPVFLDHINFQGMFKTEQERDYVIVNFLKYNGHVLHCHSLGNEFLLETV